METVEVIFSVEKPSLVDYNQLYPKMPCNTEKKQNLFEIITDAKNICGALQFTESTGSSPVAFYEKQLKSMIDSGILTELDWSEKQFVGTSTCVVMQSNGWNKTGRKQRFSKGIFKSAELYSR